MTLKKDQVEAPGGPEVQKDQEFAVIRGTTDQVVGIYGQVKNYIPIVKRVLDTVETSVLPSEWINCSIARMDQHMDHQLTQLDHFLPPAAKFDHLKDVRLADVTGAIVSIPGHVVGQWNSIRGDLSKKAVTRMEEKFEQMKHFSANKGKDMIHFDLIEFSHEVLDNANAVAKPIYEPIQKNLAAAVVKLNDAMAFVRESAKAKSSDLNARLQTAVVAARELSATSVTYMQTKYTDISAQFPSERALEEKFSTLPYPVSKAAKFILHSPQILVDIKTKTDFDTTKRTMENLQNLMAAVKEVVHDQLAPESPNAEEASSSPDN